MRGTVISLILLLCSVFMLVNAKKVSEELFERGEELVKQGKYEDASFEFRKVYALEKKGKLAERAKFLVGYYSTDPFVCIVEMKEFLEEFPKSERRGKAIIIISNNYYLLENLVRSEEYFKKYLDEFPQGEYAAPANFWLGVISFNNRAYDDSVNYLNTCIDITKDGFLEYRALTFLAYNYNKQGDKDNYRKVLDRIDVAGFDKSKVKSIIEQGNIVYERDDGYYTLQLGSFASLENAESMKKIMVDSGYTEITIFKSGSYYRVYLGRFATKGAANEFLIDFKKRHKLNPIIIKVE